MTPTEYAQRALRDLGLRYPGAVFRYWTDPTNGLVFASVTRYPPMPRRFKTELHEILQRANQLRHVEPEQNVSDLNDKDFAARMRGLRGKNGQKGR